MTVVFIIVLIIIAILFTPLGIRIQKNDYRQDVDIFLTKFFNIRIDFDEFIRLFLTSRKNRNEITFESIVNNFKLFKEFQNIIEDIFKHSQIRYLTIILKGKFSEVDYETYFKTSGYIFFEMLDEYLTRSFKKVKNTYYSIQSIKSSVKDMLVLETYVYVRLIYIIKAFITNFKDTKKIIKLLRKES